MVLKRVALTGASGMVGRHTIANLSDRLIDIVATSRSAPPFIPKGLIWREWDLREWKSPDELNDIFGPVDAILHVGSGNVMIDTSPPPRPAHFRFPVCGEKALDKLDYIPRVRLHEGLQRMINWHA